MVVWCYDVDMAEDADLTEGDMDPARTEGADLDPPECPGILEVSNCTRNPRSA